MHGMNAADFRNGQSPTSGIQEAVDSLPESGGTVFIPAGEYMLRRMVSMRENVTLRGEGPATVLKRPPVFVSLLAETTSPDPDTPEVTLEDSGSLQPGDQVALWEADQLPGGGWAYNSWLLQIAEIQGRTLRCRRLRGQSGTAFRREQGARVANLFAAISIYRVPGVTVESLTIDGGSDEPPPSPDGKPTGDFMTSAVFMHGGANFRVRDVNVCRWPSDGIYLAGSEEGMGYASGCLCEYNYGDGLHTGAGIKAARFINNTSRGNKNGFLFCQQNRNVIVANNQFLDNREYGIYGLDKTDRYCVIADNVCCGNGWCGIHGYGSVGNVIRGNICRNNSQAEPGKHAGIFLTGHEDNVVTGNLCLDDQDTPTQTRGIESIDPAGENVITDNH
jgi:parallel beta-helix repeat protein